MTFENLIYYIVDTKRFVCSNQGGSFSERVSHTELSLLVFVPSLLLFLSSFFCVP